MNNDNSKRRKQWFESYNEYCNWVNECEASQKPVKPSKKIKDWIRYQTQARFEKNNLDGQFAVMLDGINFKWDLAILKKINKKNATNENDGQQSTSYNIATKNSSTNELNTMNDNKLQTLAYAA